MARPRFALAKQKADELLRKHGIAQLPDGGIPVDEIAEQTCGAVVVYRDFHGEGELAGVLIREPEVQPIIGVAESDNPRRQRFTIAHELGHLMLHNDAYHVDRQLHWRSKESSTAEDIQEIEANVFASNLLMPAWMLEKDIDRASTDIDAAAEDLAEMYGVSVVAMTHRLARYQKYGL